MIMRVRLGAGMEVPECWHTLRPAVKSERELQAASVPSKLAASIGRAGVAAPRRIAPLKAHRMTNDNSMTRRQFVAQTAAAVALSGAGASGQGHAAPSKESLLALTAQQAARALRGGEISAESYASA